MSAPAATSSFNTALYVLLNVYLNPLIGMLVRKGVPDHLDQGLLPSADLARLAGLDSLALERALRALTAFDIFREVTPGVFANNDASDLFRNRSGGLYNWALFASSEQFLKSAAALGYSLVTGKAAHDHVFGESPWEYFRHHPEENAIFNRALPEIRSGEHLQVANAYDWSGVKTVVDIGAGAGSLIVAILEGRPGIRGIVFDQPEVLIDADRFLSERGIRDRCDLVAGSFFDPIAATGDIWAMSQVLHDWPDRECCAILQRCREQMRPADRLFIVEMLAVPCKPNPAIAVIDVGMLMFAGEARQRTTEEYERLFAQTGFELTRVFPTGSDFSIIEARPV